MTGVGAEGIDHVSIAVVDLDGAVAFFTGVLGLRQTHAEVNEREGVSEAMLAGESGGAQVQLISPVVSGGAQASGGGASGAGASAGSLSGVAKFLNERGSAIHHLALEVADVEVAANAARAAGVRVLNETPVSGTKASKIVFLHPKDCHGVLIELVQATS
jgi:methylmalonyl-CoA/ethylmalonyl-CoA epimerase